MTRTALHALLALVLVSTAGCATERDDATAGPDGPTSTTPALPSSTTSTEPPATTTSTVADVDAGPWVLASEPLANAAGAPRLLVSDGSSVVRVDGAVVVEIDGTPASVGRAEGDGSGLVVVESTEPRPDGSEQATGIVQIVDGTATPVPVGPSIAVTLFDLVVRDGAPHVLYARFQDPASVAGETTGEVVLRRLADGTATVIADAAAPEYLVHSASAASDVIALSAYSDLTEAVSFVDYGGGVVERPSPTDDLAYNRPPLVVDAVLAPDGSEVAHLEGPDVDGVDDPEGQELVGDWQVVIDDADGEQLRLTVADQSLTDVRLDFDGRWVLLSGRTADGPVEPLLIDSEATDLATYRVAGVAGRATLETAAHRDGGG